MDMKSISQKLQDDIRAIMEANLHPNQQKIDVHEPEKDEITAHDFKKLRSMKKTPDGKVHDCATHVEHAELGRGVTISEQHAEPDENGDIEWYAVQFDSGVYKVYTEDMDIIVSEAHHHGGMMKKEDTDNQIQELAGKAAQQAAIAISLIKAGKKDGKMPKPMKEDSVQEEEKKKVVSPFDYKNYKSEIPKKPGELTGHDSKKISTGTVYTKKPVKENTDIAEARKLEGTYKHTNGHESKVYKLSGEHNEGDPYHVKLFKGGKHYEPADYFTNDKEDAHSTAKHMVKEAMSHQAKTTMKHIPNASPALKKAAKDIKPGIAGIRDRFDMLDAGGVKREEVEELDELSMQTMKSAKEKLANKAYDAHMDDNKYAARNLAGRALSMQAGMNRRARRVAKEEVEQEEYTFAEYLDAARAKYVDEDAVLVANEAFKNKDITLFSDQSQSPEA
jgi:hypothetical protein